MNKLDDLTSIHHLLKAIRVCSPAPEGERPAPKESGESDSQATPNEQQQRHVSQLKVLKRELEKADALLYQLEQDDVVPIPSIIHPVVAESYQPCSIIRQATQARPLFTKTSLGLDVGSYAIKAVELGHTPAGYTLLHYALVEIASTARHSPDYSQALIEGNSKAIAGVDMRRAEVVTSIGSSSSIIHQLSLPPMSQPELSSCLKWEAKRLIPNDKQERELGFQVLKEGNASSPMEVLLVAVPHSLILGHLELMSKAQIKPAITDMSPLALINTYLAKGRHKTDEALLLLDIGAETTMLTIYQKNAGYFVRHISVSGNSLTRQIQKELKMEFLQAEQWKRHPHQEMTGLLEPLLQQMILEIRQALTHYRNKTLTRDVKRLILSGGSAQLPQLDSYLARELGLEVEAFNPFVTLNIDRSYFPHADLNGISSQFATAVGLAIRGSKRNSRAINLLENRVLSTAKANIAQAYIGIFTPAGGAP